MYCMKCGKEIPEKQVFCDSCLEVMSRFPVKPETRIQLPNRTAPEAVKKAAPKKKVLTAEEKLPRFKKAVQWLSIALIVTMFALALSISFLVDALAPKESDDVIGQNYNTVDMSDGDR